MKKLTQLFVTGLLVLKTLPALAGAEVVTEKIATNKKWVATKLTGHSAWGTEACVAATLSGAAVLEIYAEKVDKVYTEPTVQVLFNQAKQVYSAELLTDSGTMWALTLANAPQDPNMQVVLARLKDRESIIQALKQATLMTVKLRDVKGKTIQQLSFSLSGSSKTIDAATKACDLKFELIP